MTDDRWVVVAYEEEDGTQPFVGWYRGLSLVKRAAVRSAVTSVLEVLGPDVVEIGMGRNIGGGLFEFYIENTAAEIAHRFASGEPPVSGRAEEVWLRLFCHPHAERRILVITGYDKGRHGERRQTAAISDARKRLGDWQRRQRR